LLEQQRKLIQTIGSLFYENKFRTRKGNDIFTIFIVKYR
jgi:hypothetical protein